MTTTARVYQNQPGTAVSTLYSVVSATSPNGDLIKEIILTNCTANNANVTLYVVPSGGTAGVANAIAYNYTVPGNSIVVLALCTDIEIGETIQGSQTTPNAITVTITNYRK